MKNSILLIILLVLTWICPVMGYVPDSPVLLEFAVEKMGKPDRLAVEQELEIFDTTFEKGYKVFRQKLWYKIADSFRSETKSEDKNSIHVCTKESSITILNNQIISEQESLLDLYKDILLLRDRELIFKKLELVGIDMLSSGLGRFKGRLSFILGSSNNDFSKSQLWVDKETFLPSRLIIVKDSGKLEIQYNEWKKLSKTWYPRRIEFFVNDIISRIIRVKKVFLNPMIKDNIFDTEYLKAVYKKEKVNIKNEDEIKKTIDKFNKKF